MQVRSSTTVTALVGVLLVGMVLGGGIVHFVGAPGDVSLPETNAENDPELATFGSEEEFRSYFDEATVRRTTRLMTGGTDDAVGVEEGDAADGAGDDGGTQLESDVSAGSETRYSETNIQEAGLDEPDVLKTDGEEAYYSGHQFQRNADETSVLDLSDPAEPGVTAVLPASGELLLVEDEEMLLVLDDDRIWGYDVSDPSDPDHVWDERVDSELQTARLHEDGLYTVFVERPDLERGCEIRPMGDDVIPCTNVYRPGTPVDADAVYTAARIDPTSGEIESETSVVGSQRDSATYVSENAIYLSYTDTASHHEFMFDFLTGPGADIIDEGTLERLKHLKGLDISERAKSTELDVIMQEYMSSLDDDERQAVQEELDEEMETYAAEQQREHTRTGIVRIALEDDLDVSASGEVPGYPLNQWSMDEHEEHLRIATTIPGLHGADSENDVYVLDEDLDVTGSVEGLGETERIYSVRFEGDEGHVVTFRQIDPFYTLDLSDPTDPQVEGELKIPGVSHYLHPLDEDGELVLGVGEEEGEVKLSTFDVSDRDDPTEEHAVILEDERYTEVNRNHRAFLHDARHQAFFVPGHEASYVYSYDEAGQLTEEAELDVGGPGVRAMYLDDYLYVFGDEEIVVLDETTWETVTTVDAR